MSDLENKAIERLKCASDMSLRMQNGIARWDTADDVFHWWLEDGVLPGQLGFEDLEEDE